MDQREIIGDHEEAIRAAVNGFLLDTWTALPGIVQSYDPATGTCTVQPSTKAQQLMASAQGTTQQWTSISPIPNMPLFFLGGGEMVVECQPQKDDECLIVFSSRCIDGWWKNGGVQIQPVLRHHNLSDGFVLVGPLSLPNLFASLGAGLRMRKRDGSAFIEVKPDGSVNVLAPGGMTITVGATTITVAASGSVGITAPAGVTVTGDLTVTGAITGAVQGTFDGIPFSTHKHTGVASGSDNTGGPTP